MRGLDYWVLLGYLAGLLVVGGIFTKIKDSAEMFAAGRRAPWWVSGLSGFMTIFTAGTFVVWGGIAYRLGLVSVSILGVTSVSMIVVGFCLAGRWREMGLTTPAEFLELRFGKATLQLYVWLGTVCRSLGMAVALYALSVMLVALIPLPEGNVLRDSRTGNLSATWAILICGIAVVGYTVAGGLWAVLMSEVIQCIVLCLSVAIAVPLCLMRVGGFGNLVARAPAGFFAPVAGEFGGWFLFFWAVLGFFRYGADWAFVQRYICVPTVRDARRVAYLMGGLYVVAPFLWMLPAMAYRVLNNRADPEQAYILICREVLPEGMLGMMMAAMFSATASTVSSLLNVFAGVFTRDVYRPLIRPEATERHLVKVGRIVTLGYGALIIGGALTVPYMGGAEQLVLTLTTLLLGPLMLPVVWGVFSRRINHRAIWVTLAVSGVAGALTKAGFTRNSRTAPWGEGAMAVFSRWAQENNRLLEGIVGFVVPFTLLLIMELLARHRQTDSGWLRLREAVLRQRAETPAVGKASTLPARIVAWTLGVLGAVMAVIALIAPGDQRVILFLFSALLASSAGGVVWVCHKRCT